MTDPNPTGRVPLPGSARPSLTDEASPLVDPDERVEFTVVLRRRADLPGDLVETMDTVSRDELGDRFGADPADIAAVRAVLAAGGVTVTGEHPGSRRLIAAGPAASVSTLFGTELRRASSVDPTSRATVTHRARSGQLHVPSALDGIVVAVLGLDDRPQVRAHVRAHADPEARAGFDVPTLGTVYGFPTGTDGTGQVAAIVEFGGGFGQDDLDAFFGGLSIAPPSVTAVGVDGGQNVAGQDPNGADGEVLLDIEVIGALAPKATVKVYFAPNSDQGFVDAVSTAVHASPTPAVVSISWGQSEDQWTEQARTALDQVFADAAALGVTVCAASGDNGSEDAETDGQQHVDYPSSSQYVLGCGGTRLTAANGAATAETVWNDGQGGGATGGGVSDVFPVPSWQADAGVPARVGGGVGRGVPDVSGNADPNTGYNIRVDGKALVIGGTSAVAPLWSALVCRLTQALDRRLGLLQPVLYGSAAAGRTASGFRDITEGNNGAYQAGPGWDACTGLGVPIGSDLLAVFQQHTAGGGTASAS
ncbi:MAG TPA: S53 family peptidase [Pseudonocardiaceae bacterium]|nr:S53 family peptidase [Pseudonocardiaceae bacterium]